MTKPKAESDNFTLAGRLARRIKKLDAQESAELRDASAKVEQRFRAKRDKAYAEAGEVVTRMAAAALEAEIEGDLPDVDVDVSDGLEDGGP